MKIAVWVTEGTWPACVDAARELIGSNEADVLLIHVREGGRPAPETGHGSLMGRRRRQHAEDQLTQLSEEAA